MIVRKAMVGNDDDHSGYNSLHGDLENSVNVLPHCHRPENGGTILSLFLSVSRAGCRYIF